MYYHFVKYTFACNYILGNDSFLVFLFQIFIGFVSFRFRYEKENFGFRFWRLDSDYIYLIVNDSN